MTKYSRDPNRPLSAQQRKFVEEYLRTANGTAAAIAAGYSRANAADRACQMTRRSEPVKQAIAAVRKELTARGIYSAEKAMDEADEAITFARETENANAYVKAVELKAKLNGLLIEKHDVRTQGFVVNIKGIDDAPGVDPGVVVATSRRVEDDDDDIFG